MTTPGTQVSVRMDAPFVRRSADPADDGEVRLVMRPLDAPDVEEAIAGESAGLWTRLWRIRWFIGLVVVPTLLATIYFGAIAADRYEIETRFIVRATSSPAANSLNSVLQSSSITRSNDDTYAVHSYLQSRDVVAALEKEIGLRTLLSRPEADFLWRYPRPWPLADTSEHLWRHFQSFIALDFDASTGISTLRATAFRPEDAKQIAEMLLRQSETLINRLNNRAQRDAVASTEREVERARSAAESAQRRVTEFRMREAIVDPARVTNAAFEIISRMALETAQANSQLAEVQKTSPQSAQIGALRNRIAALEEQIAKERRILAGDDQSMAARIAEYEQLTLGREFTERIYQAALVAMSQARFEAQRQRLFLETISTPGVPDYPTYPARILGILLVFAISYMIYRIVRRFVADVETHAEI